MKKVLDYKDINQVLTGIKVQIIDSLPFAESVCPKFETLRELWDWLAPQLHFKSDPKGREYLQTMQTLFKNDGQGDCDCFVITTIACLIVNGFPDVYICLTGRQKSHPVHIYVVVYENGDRTVLDFTNRGHFNYERDNYKYIQEIAVNWQKWKINV